MCVPLPTCIDAFTLPPNLPQVYPNGSAVSFMVPPFAGTPIYPVPAGFRPVKMEGADW